MGMKYDEEYFKKRRAEVDKTEWLDIYWALKALGIPRDAYIVDLGAGEGGLVRFLRGKGYYKTIGFDVAVENDVVRRMDLTRELPHKPDVCASQHFLEHIPQERAAGILAYCLTEGMAFIAVVPGHHSDDPTHVVNHYEYEDLVNFAEKVASMARRRVSYRVEPDAVSHLVPEARDWLLVMSSVHPDIPPLKPLALRLALKALRGVARALWALGGVRV